MRKILLLVLTCTVFQLQAQNFRLRYFLTGCPGNPLNGASGIYLYAGAGTQNATSTYDYTAGTFSGDSLPLTFVGNNTWEICFDPYQIFYDMNGAILPASTPIFNFEVNFRDSSGNIFTGQCGSGSYIKIDNPMTSPQTIFPNIVQGLAVITCVVGLEEMNNQQATVIQFPNPMNHTGSTFKINLPSSEKVTLQVYNMLGNKVRTLLDEQKLSGIQEVYFNGKDDKGNLLPGGCYFYSLEAGKSKVTGRVVILR